MKQKKLFLVKKMLVPLIALGVIIGFQFLTSAKGMTPEFSPVTKNQSSEKTEKHRVHNPEKMKNNLEKALNEGVNSNIINQNEKSRIMDYYNNKVTSKSKTNIKEKHDFFTEAADKGIITADKAAKLRTLMHNSMVQSKFDGVKKRLDNLVSDKTITADQENKIIEELKKDYKR